VNLYYAVIFEKSKRVNFSFPSSSFLQYPPQENRIVLNAMLSFYLVIIALKNNISVILIPPLFIYLEMNMIFQ